MKNLTMMHRMFKHTVAAGLLGVAALGGARAATFTENFEAPFPAWESGWFGAQTDANNYYCNARNCTYRGNNPDGLWLFGNGSIVTVQFEAAFAASLSSLQIDVAGYLPTRLIAVDKNGAKIFEQPIALTFGATSDPGVYSTYTITSTTGIGGFYFPDAPIGFTSIDNLVATTAPIPEPTTVALMLAGLAAVGAAARRQTKTRG